MPTNQVDKNHPISKRNGRRKQVSTTTLDVNHVRLSESLRLDYTTLPVGLQDDRILFNLSSIVDNMDWVYTSETWILTQVRIYGRLGILRPTSETLVDRVHLALNRVST